MNDVGLFHGVLKIFCLFIQLMLRLGLLNFYVAKRLSFEGRKKNDQVLELERTTDFCSALK